LGVSLSQRSDLLDRIASHRVGQIFLSIFEPRIECGRSLGESEEEIFDLPELFLHVEEALLASVRICQQFLPSGDNIGVTLQNSRTLVVIGSDQLVLESCDVLDSLMFKCGET
jgi:hypothetical protein